ncbi:hypothetical protein L6164_009067 [Bauhinia variegata]|uniref:Uncharacterized protein n=1 Tax=Bauhinia variegata TaxID=167791 RepID=A0ACB9PJV0_BAUVA|nr:hypothetical protein L6164_009067 [Bauhinia variegata]
MEDFENLDKPKRRSSGDNDEFFLEVIWLDEEFFCSFWFCILDLSTSWEGGWSLNQHPLRFEQSGSSRAKTEKRKKGYRLPSLLVRMVHTEGLALI